MEDKIKDALDQIRPFLQRDGGDIEFVEYTDDNIVKVRLQGHCAGCPGAQMTIKGVVEKILKESYPEVAGVEGSNIIFNIVFFITIVSLVVQGTTISFVARMLNLSKPLEKTGNDFGVELPEEIDSDLSDMTITTEMLEEADTLKDMNLPKGTLVMIVKRGDEFLIPNGTLKLHVGDKLLLISEKSKEEVNESE